ncbi:hypothetical protein HK098_002208 [Nowakowskiella sp. JEL0407]|nr:hypothetical protein HK098_002208 [Nowakowskiella sp. JEL0407]
MEWLHFLEVEIKQLDTFEELQKSRGLRGSGIVSFVNSPASIKYLSVAIRLLRGYGCNLPIEIFAFNGEIPSSYQAQLTSLSTPTATVKFRTVDDWLNPFPLSRNDKDSWHVKLGAILNSSFEKVISMDADIFFFKNPEYLFTSDEFLSEGAIFWPDFWKTHSDNPVWRWLGMDCTDEFEQESGVTVIDKSRSWRALMLMWFWNKSEESRKFVTSFLHGDKDQFRFSFRASNTSYHMVQHVMSLGGFVASDGNFCGQAILQKRPSDKDKVLFAHVNMMKHNMLKIHENLFNENRPILQKVKQYVDGYPKDYNIPPGYLPGTLKSFARWGKMQTYLVVYDGLLCVDFGPVSELEVFDQPDMDVVVNIMKVYFH